MPPLSVLFLCTHNSARSIMAEALLNHLGGGRCLANSAGSHPAGRIHPLALRVLEAQGVPTQGLRSKNWNEFTVPGASSVAVVITVCDSAADEMCPIWPGAPLKAHWGVEEPSTLAAGQPEAGQLAAFAYVCARLERRLRRLLELPLEGLDPAVLKAELNRIGQLE